MRYKMLVTLGLTVATAALTSAPAFANDPCRQAYNEVQDARDRYNAWVAAHCPQSGTCTGNAAEYERRRAAVQRALANVPAYCP